MRVTAACGDAATLAGGLLALGPFPCVPLRWLVRALQRPGLQGDVHVPGDKLAPPATSRLSLPGMAACALLTLGNQYGRNKIIIGLTSI